MNRFEKVRLPLVTALVIMLSLSTFAFSYVKVYRMMTNMSYERLSDAARTVAGDVSDLLDSNAVALDIAAEHLALLGSLDSPDAMEVLERYSSELTATRVSILLPDDRIVTLDGILEPTSIHFNELISLGKGFSARDTSKLYPDETIVRQLVPIENEEGQSLGILYAVYKCSDFTEMLPNSVYDGNTGVYIIDRRDGNIIADTYSGVFDNIKDRNGEPVKHYNAFDPDDLLAGGSGYFCIRGATSGRKVFMSYAPTDYEEFSITLSIFEDAAMAQVADYRRFIILIGLAECLMFVIYGLWVMNHNKKDIKKLTEIANTDMLTGAGSVTLFTHDCAELDKHIKEGDMQPFAVVECDLNSLKKVNDSLGHDAGNNYIIRSYEAINDAFPDSKVYRIGGDEFALILVGRDFANRHDLLAGLQSTSDQRARNISFASGMADFEPGRDKNINDVLKRADEAMYENKEAMKSGQNV